MFRLFDLHGFSVVWVVFVIQFSSLSLSIYYIASPELHLIFDYVNSVVQT